MLIILIHLSLDAHVISVIYLIQTEKLFYLFLEALKLSDHPLSFFLIK
jgi:hypothetical protein